MAKAYESLAAEIDRVVNSPYPTQLKSLRDIVCTQCSEADISKWALSRPCQIDRLVECVLDGLRQWPYMLELATKLMSDVQFRNATLRQSPTFLHDIISQAVNAASLESKYVVAAVTMLSHSLPENVLAPAEVQTLFIRLFDQAADEPSLQNIRRVYLLLQGISTLLLGLLSSSSLLRLEEHLFVIIRNIKGDNQALSLYCLAIMRIMCSASTNHLGLSHSQYDTQELLASTQLTSSAQWTTDAVQQFFTDGKAHKTVQLVVLRAMWACTVSTGEAFDERLMSLVLANEIISAVPANLREAWRKANSLVFGKLQEKVMASTLELELRFQGLCFLSQVAEGSRVPATVLDSLRALVTVPKKLRLALTSAPNAQIERLLDAGVFDESTISALLQNVVEMATSSSSEQWLQTATRLQDVLSKIYGAVPSDAKLGEGIMLALDVIACGHKLHELRDLVKDYGGYATGTGSAHACVSTTQNARKSLIHDLCRIFLRAALSSPHQSYSASQDTVVLLLELHGASTPSLAACSHHVPSHNSNTKTSIVETASSADPGPLSWREATRRLLHSRADQDETSLTAVFAKACADLEARCESVEAPLREERVRTSALKKQYDELARAYDGKEAEIAERDVRFHALEMERNQYISDLELQREEMETHERRVEELLQELQRAREDSERSLAEAKDAAATAQLDHAAAFARKEEELEEMQAQLKDAQHQGQSVGTEVGLLRGQLSEAQSSLEGVRTELQSAEELNHHHESNLRTIQQERDDAVLREARNEDELRRTKEDTTAQRESLERALGDLRQQTEHDLARANRERDEKIRELTGRYEASAEELRRQLRSAEDGIGQAREQHRADVEQRVSELTEKQKKIDRLARKCTEKDNQIAEANLMRTNLMAAMGIGGQQTGRQNLPIRASRSSVTQQTQPHDVESQDDPSPPTPFSGDDSQKTELDHGSFASNATSSGESRSGPTPKRPRSRKSVLAHSPAQLTTRQSVGVGAGASLAPRSARSTVKIRQPLLGVSGNQHRLPGRSSLKTPSKGFGTEEEMFEGSEIFAGTPGQELMDIGGALDDETETGL